MWLHIAMAMKRGIMRRPTFARALSSSGELLLGPALLLTSIKPMETPMRCGTARAEPRAPQAAGAGQMLLLRTRD